MFTIVYMSSDKVPVILVIYVWNLNFPNTFSKNSKMSNLLKTLPVGVESFHADGQTDARADMTKLRAALRNFANAPKNRTDEYSWPQRDSTPRSQQ
jgi:hypothetical protein